MLKEVVGLLDEIEPHVVARVRELVAKVGEDEFRRGVAMMTGWDTGTRRLDDVMFLYVMARRGKVHPPEIGRQVAATLDGFPDRTDDDAGFCDDSGRRITPQEYVAWRTARREELARP